MRHAACNHDRQSQLLVRPKYTRCGSRDTVDSRVQLRSRSVVGKVGAGMETCWSLALGTKRCVGNGERPQLRQLSTGCEMRLVASPLMDSAHTHKTGRWWQVRLLMCLRIWPRLLHPRQCVCQQLGRRRRSQLRQGHWHRHYHCHNTTSAAATIAIEMPTHWQAEHTTYCAHHNNAGCY